MAAKNGRSSIQHDSNFAFDEDEVTTASVDLGKGDYSTHMEELFSDDDNDQHIFSDSDEVGEGFVYTGRDAETPDGGYYERMHDILGPDTSEEVLDIAKSTALQEQGAPSDTVFQVSAIISPLYHF